MGVLVGKVAIVTGAAHGQGLAEAARFVAEGASVVLTDVLGDEGTAAAATLGANARFVTHDITSAADWDTVVDTAVREFGGLDILVNNAGIHVVRPIEDTDEATFRRVLDINLVGAFLGIQAATPALRTRGGGSIVNIASIAGLKAVPVSVAYVTSKFGLRGLTRSAAAELGVYGIRVNAVCPGVIRTEMTRAVLDDREARVASVIPLRRVGEPEEVADLVLFLASEASRWITGAEHVIDGGSMA